MSEMSTNKTRLMKAILTCNKVLRLVGAFCPKQVHLDGELWDIVRGLFVHYIRSLNYEEVNGSRRSTDELVLLGIEILNQRLPTGPLKLAPADSPFKQF